MNTELQEIKLPKDFKVGDNIEVYFDKYTIRSTIDSIVELEDHPLGGNEIIYFDRGELSSFYIFEEDLSKDQSEWLRVYGYRENKVVEMSKILSLKYINRMGLKNVKY